MQHADTTAPISHPANVIEDITDLAERLPVLERAVLGMIMLGFNQVEIARLLQERKNTISTIKIRARTSILEQFYD
jgi:DNA-directed RNA polymerase specialized sigma24 family protein